MEYCKMDDMRYLSKERHWLLIWTVNAFLCFQKKGEIHELWAINNFGKVSCGLGTVLETVTCWETTEITDEKIKKGVMPIPGEAGFVAGERDGQQ